MARQFATALEVLDVDTLDSCGLHIANDGQLVLPDGNPPALSRDPQRRRHQFTKDDDELLLLWITSAEREGLKTTRPFLFEELERACPRHTAQSWQSRWMRVVKNASRPEIATPPIPGQNPSAVTSSARPEPDAGFTDSTDIQTLPQGAEHSPDPDTLEVETHTVDTGRTMPPGRYFSDESVPPPAHFRTLPIPSSVADGSTHHARAESESELCSALGVGDRQGLRAWLVQDWVIDAYIEYASAQIDSAQGEEMENNDGNDDPDEEESRYPAHENADGVEEIGTLDSGANASSDRHSSQKYIVNNAYRVILSLQDRYLHYHSDHTAWTRDDFDIRFVAQIASAGTQPGNWWEAMSNAGDTRRICMVVYRLMLWIRHMHRYARTRSTKSLWKKTTGMYWVGVLNEARLQRSRRLASECQEDVPLSIRTKAAVTTLSTTVPPSPDINLESPAPMLTSQSPIDLDHVTTPRSEARHVGAAGATDTMVIDTGDADAIQQHSVTLDGVNMQAQEAADVSGTSQLDVRHEYPSSLDRFQPGSEPPPDVLPPVHITYAPTRYPSFPGKESRQIPGQVRALEWLTAAGKKSFALQQDRLLATWGVKRGHNLSCVLVPQDWANLNPLDLAYKTEADSCPVEKSTRLRFNLADHITSWVRAATWFNHQPVRNGSELDVFLGVGPFIPMDGSHLCHHGFCVVPEHLVYEDTIVNASRRRCLFEAQDLRRRILHIPDRCSLHNPPCFLQLSALTLHETHLLQLWVLRKSRCLPEPLLPNRTPDHPWPTLEHCLPLSFDALHRDLDLDMLVSPGELPPDAELQVPTFYCVFCSNPKSFKKVASYWGHIRDRHGLVDTEKRVEEVRSSAAVWKTHLAHHLRRYGKAHALDNATLLKLDQIDAANFGWDVVLSWKLNYQRER